MECLCLCGDICTYSFSAVIHIWMESFDVQVSAERQWMFYSLGQSLGAILFMIILFFVPWCSAHWCIRIDMRDVLIACFAIHLKRALEWIGLSVAASHNKVLSPSHCLGRLLFPKLHCLPLLFLHRRYLVRWRMTVLTFHSLVMWYLHQKGW